jgi:hypothetical protein
MGGDVEFDKCDFCQIEKPVGRTYLRPSKYVKPENPEIISSSLKLVLIVVNLKYSSEFGRNLIRQDGNYHFLTNYSESIDK